MGVKAAALPHGSTTPSCFVLLYQSLGGLVLFTDVNRIWSRWSGFLSQSAANWSTENGFKCLLVLRIAPQLLPFAGRQRLFGLVFKCCWFVRPPDVRPGTRYRCSPPALPFGHFPAPHTPPAAFALCGNTNWRLLVCPGCQLEFVTLWQIEIF